MPKHTKHTRRPRLQRVKIKVEEKREPDWERFAWAVLQHARIQMEGEQKPPRRKPAR